MKSKWFPFFKRVHSLVRRGRSREVVLAKLGHLIKITLLVDQYLSSNIIRAKNRADSVKVEGRNQNQQMLIEKKLSIHAKVVESNNNNISTFPTDYRPKVTR